jgi:hypothetical protein
MSPVDAADPVLTIAASTLYLGRTVAGDRFEQIAATSAGRSSNRIGAGACAPLPVMVTAGEPFTMTRIEEADADALFVYRHPCRSSPSLSPTS